MTFVSSDLPKKSNKSILKPDKGVEKRARTFLNVLKSKESIYCQHFMHEYVINLMQCSYNRQLTSASKVQLHFGTDIDYFEKLSHYSFGARVVKLNKGTKVRELFEDAVFN